MSLYRQALDVYKDPEIQKAFKDEIERIKK